MMCICPVCGAFYIEDAAGRGTHCRSCCTTFASQQSFDAHRTWGYDGERRCMFHEEMLSKGWRDIDRGWTNNRPLPDQLHARSG